MKLTLEEKARQLDLIVDLLNRVGVPTKTKMGVELSVYGQVDQALILRRRELVDLENEALGRQLIELRNTKWELEKDIAFVCDGLNTIIDRLTANRN